MACPSYALAPPHLAQDRIPDALEIVLTTQTLRVHSGVEHPPGTAIKHLPRQVFVDGEAADGDVEAAGAGQYLALSRHALAGCQEARG